MTIIFHCRFKGMVGIHIKELKIFQTQAPKYFLNVTQYQLSLTLHQMLTFSELLRRM